MWIPKREYLSMKKMVEDHEKDLREQLETNHKVWAAIEELKASAENAEALA